jgi:Eisosome component PIL1
LNESDLSKKLAKLLTTETDVIRAYEAAAEDRDSVAHQLSYWGLSTNDDSVSEVSDKIGVILQSFAEQEEQFSQGLLDSRSCLKQIKHIEASVQPSRDNKGKISAEIQKLKYKDPSSSKLVTLEQELVRAEAQNLVAEAQLTNVVSHTLHARTQ